MPHHIYLFQNLGAVADQGCPTNGCCQSAIFDEIPLAHAEHEITFGDIGLPSPQHLDVEAFLHRVYYLLGVTLTSGDEGVRHARHGQITEGLATTIAGRVVVGFASLGQVPHILL